MGAASAVLGWLDSVVARYKFSSVFVLHNDLLAAMEPLETRMPFFWARDPADLVISQDAATYAGMGHNTRSDELADVSSFLTGQVPGSFVPSG